MSAGSTTLGRLTTVATDLTCSGWSVTRWPGRPATAFVASSAGRERGLDLQVAIGALHLLDSGGSLPAGCTRGVLHPDGGLEVECVQAPPGILITSGGAAHLVPDGGRQSQSLRMTPGDQLLLVTCAVLEDAPEQLRATIEAIARHQGPDAVPLHDELVTSLLSHCRPGAAAVLVHRLATSAAAGAHHSPTPDVA